MYSLPVSRTLVWRFTNAMDGVCPCNGMVVCPKFGHPVQSSDICKGKNNFTKIVNVLLVLKLFQLTNGDFIIFVCLFRNSIIPKS